MENGYLIHMIILKIAFLNTIIPPLSKFSKNVDAVPLSRMGSNIARVAGVFLLIGGIFKAVSKVVDKK